MLNKLRKALLKASIPVQKWMQKIHPPEPNLSYQDAIRAASELQLGDILISKNHLRLTNLFIPGYWSHAAIYDGQKVIEAVGTGVQEVHPVEWLLKCNDFAILRPQAELTAQAQTVMFTWLRMQIGKPYDYMFNLGAHKEWYCSELAFYAWNYVEEIIPWTQSFTLRRTWGELTVVADDFYEAMKKGKLTLIYEHYQKGKK